MTNDDVALLIRIRARDMTKWVWLNQNGKYVGCKGHALPVNRAYAEFVRDQLELAVPGRLEIELIPVEADEDGTF